MEIIFFAWLLGVIGTFGAYAFCEWCNTSNENSDKKHDVELARILCERRKEMANEEKFLTESEKAHLYRVEADKKSCKEVIHGISNDNSQEYE